MRVLIACAYSEIERDSFAAKGHDAWSCDLLPASGNHFQCDVLEIINDGWDLMIAHPDCTFLTASAEWAYADVPMIKGKPRKIKPGTLIGAERRAARDKAVEFFRLLLNAPIEKIAVENPVGCISSRIRKPDQYIQPYDFGEDASKRTGLWLKNLPKLIQTKKINPRYINGLPRWGNQTDSGQNKETPSDDRWKKRAKTYEGWAIAMADQWGNK